MASARERIARPELRPVVEEQHPAGGMSCWYRPDSQVSERVRVPPVELDDLPRGKFAGQWIDAGSIKLRE